MKQNALKILVKSLFAGVAIGVGGTVYLAVDNSYVGAFLFSLGLFTIYTFNLSLYTGKVCYIPNKPIQYLREVGIVFMGNAVGGVAYGYVLRGTRFEQWLPKVQDLVAHKLADGVLSTFVMAVLCGIMMCIAVLGFQTIQDSVGKHLALVLPIMVFILAGFEHSIANLFYYSLAHAWNAHAAYYLIVIALGNLVGGALLPLVVRYTDGKKLGC